MLAQVLCPGGGNRNAGAAFRWRSRTKASTVSDVMASRSRDEAIQSFLHASKNWHQIGQLPHVFGPREANNSVRAALRGCDEQRGITP